MSRSYRTQERSRLAERRIQRTVDGELRYPRVISRKPRKGDSHPLSRKFMQALMRKVPVEYLYGLDRIELRARQNAEIGDPFGLYLIDEKTIILYSLPMVWSWRGISPCSRPIQRLRNFHAEITVDGESLHVRWPSVIVRGLWFYIEVFAHELGHHHRNQYRSRNRKASRLTEEMIADLHSERFYRALVKRIRARSRSASDT